MHGGPPRHRVQVRLRRAQGGHCGLFLRELSSVVVAVHTRALCRNGRCSSDFGDTSSIVDDSVLGDVSSAGSGSASAVRVVSYASIPE